MARSAGSVAVVPTVVAVAKVSPMLNAHPVNNSQS